MSIDYTKNAYIKIADFSNVVNEVDKFKLVAEARHYLYRGVGHLVQQLALRHPEWLLVGESSWFNQSELSYPVKAFRVYEQDEEIGAFRLDGYNQTIIISNARIRNQLQRRNHRKTSDPDKALKIIEKNFSSKTVRERVEAARLLVANTISAVSYETHHNLGQAMGGFQSSLLKYLLANLDEVSAELTAMGANPDTLARLPELATKYREASGVGVSHSGNRGTTVVLYGDRYILITDSAPDEPTIATASQLSPELVGKLGLLKLVGYREVIESVGVRVNATIFYISG